MQYICDLLDDIITLPIVHSEKAIQLAKDQRPIDDLFFTRLIEDPGVMQEIATAVLGIPVIVTRVNAQFAVYNLDRRSIRADAVAVIEMGSIPQSQNGSMAVIQQFSLIRKFPIREGTLLAMEAQKKFPPDEKEQKGSSTSETTKKASRKKASRKKGTGWVKKVDMQRRLRLNSSLLTGEFTEKGTDYGDIPDIILVTLADYDSIGSKMFVSYARRCFYDGEDFQHDEDTARVLENGMSELYVDGMADANVDNPYEINLKALMNLLVSREDADPDSPLFPETRKRIRIIRNNEEVIHDMAASIEEAIQEAVEEAEADTYAVCSDFLDKVDRGELSMDQLRQILSDRQKKRSSALPIYA